MAQCKGYFVEILFPVQKCFSSKIRLVLLNKIVYLFYKHFILQRSMHQQEKCTHHYFFFAIKQKTKKIIIIIKLLRLTLMISIIKKLS